MNAYDFDKTIYRDDSSVDFFLFCLKKRKQTLLSLPRTALYGIGYLLRLCDKTKFKQAFFGFLRRLDNTEVLVEEFWEVNSWKIKRFYLEKKSSTDIIISASPEFLLSPVCKHAKLIGSKVDSKTGIYTGENCYGKEKVNRLYQELPGCKFDEFYSDSLSDTPLAMLAEKAYMVLGDNLIPWNEYKH